MMPPPIVARAMLVMSSAFIASFFLLQAITPTYSFLGSALADSIFALGGCYAYSVVGTLITSRHPRLVIGWILAVAGLLLSVEMAVDRYAAYTINVDPTLPLGTIAAWLSGWLWMPADVAIVTLVPLLFPSGRLASPRWRPALLLASAAMLLGPVRALRPGPVSDVWLNVPNPFALPGPLGQAAAALETVLFATWGLAALLAVVALIVRLRRARGIERQQLKWFGSAMAFLALAFAAVTPVYAVFGYSAAAEFVTGIPAVGLSMLPIAAGIAILRYRLYDIDVLINRTLIYGATSVAIAIAFVSGLIAFQALLRPFTAGNELAVAVSTLGSFALIEPVRTRVRDAVDRRFYRSRYDSARTLDAFTARLRDIVELDAVRSDVIEVVSRTVAPAYVDLWLRDRGRVR